MSSHFECRDLFVIYADRCILAFSIPVVFDIDVPCRSDSVSRVGRIGGMSFRVTNVVNEAVNEVP